MDQTMQAPRGFARTLPVQWRAVCFVALLAVYVLFTLGVVHQSPLLTVDRDVVRLGLRERWPGWYSWIVTYVMLGQRGPTTLVALPWFVWRAWKSRSARPLIMLGTALLVLNLSVGVVKLAVGRIGPLRTHNVQAVFAGGNIFPSGHVSNAVVLYGVIAMLAVSYRRTAIALAVFISLTVGMSTIYLDTHWLTDVVGGWMAGGLVLLALPTVMPYSQRSMAALGRGLRHVWQAARPRPEHAATPRPPAMADRTPDGVRVIRSHRSAPLAPSGVPTVSAANTAAHAKV